MCLTPVSGDLPQIAKRGFYTYKIVNAIDVRKGSFISKIRSFEYNIGYHYYETTFPKKFRRVTINALHSFKISRLKGQHKSALSEPIKYNGYFILCYVPKGAKYYEGARDIVSSDLIILSRITSKNYKDIPGLK